MWKVHIKTICGQKQPDTAWKVSVFVVILIPIFPYSDQNNSEYGHFLCSARSRNEACNFIKKETPTHRWIFQNSKNTFLAEHLRETAFLGDFNFPAVLRNLSRAFEKRLRHRWFPSKRGSDTGDFLWILRTFLRIAFFTEQLRVTASEDDFEKKKFIKSILLSKLGKCSFFKFLPFKH